MITLSSLRSLRQAARLSACRALCRTVMAAPSNTHKIALIQLAVGADKQKNVASATAKIKEAATAGAELVVLPECFNCPYGNKFFPTYAEDIEAGDSPTATALSQAAKDNGVVVIGGSIPEKSGDKLFNTSLAFDASGTRIAKHQKVHLFDIDVPGGIRFIESETLSAGNEITIIDIGWAKIGLGICYDIRFPELALLARHKYGADILVYPGAFNMTTGPKHWELLARGRAVDCQTYVVVCSPARDESADYVAWGHSMLVDPWAEVQASAQEAETIVYSHIDMESVAAVRKAIPTSAQRRLDVYKIESLRQ